MAQTAMGGAAQETSLFVRKATGLVRAWSVFDAFIYATFSINLVTLGLYSLSLSYGFNGNLVTAVVVGALFTIFEVIVYANLIAVMPRAGGDYIWQSRILGGAIGFILAVTGWWFILWLWVPLYGQMLVYEFFTPVLAILGAQGAAIWFSSTPAGLLTGSLVSIAFVSFYIALGMKWYARIQKFCFVGGMLGLLAAFILLLFGNNQTFVNNLNQIVPTMFGTAPGDLYQATLEAGKDFAQTAPIGTLAFAASFAIIPMIAFFNLWPNWGATLYGEVRGSTDYRRNFWGMGLAVIVTTLISTPFISSRVS